jgi:hypothetical protein
MVEVFLMRKIKEIKNKFFPESIYSIILLIQLFWFAPSLPAQPVQVYIEWNKILNISKTTPTLQVVGNPRLRSPLPHT